MDPKVIIGILIGVFVFLFLIGVVASNSMSYSEGSSSRSISVSGCSTGTCQLGGGQGQVVLFFAPWCGHCQTIKPTWNKLEKMFKGRVVSVNGDKNKALAGKFKIDGFPTVYYCPNGKTNPKGKILYEGDRSKADLVKFIKRHIK